jgi:hypothetical protein
MVNERGFTVIAEDLSEPRDFALQSVYYMLEVSCLLGRGDRAPTHVSGQLRG